MRLYSPKTAVLAGVLAVAVVSVSCSPGTSPSTESAEQEVTSATEQAPAVKERAPAAKEQAPVSPPPRQATLAAGTAMAVRTTSTISTKTAKPGDVFMASLEEPIVEGNWVIAPKGAKVEGTVVTSDPGGRVQGTATLAVRCTTITTDDGQTIQVSTTPQSFQAESSTKKDALKVGIASGVGAAIGAIAGGGRGAAIGAGVGAGAGTGTVLATRGDAAVLPSETVLNFELASPVTITERR